MSFTCFMIILFTKDLILRKNVIEHVLQFLWLDLTSNFDAIGPPQQVKAKCTSCTPPENCSAPRRKLPKTNSKEKTPGALLCTWVFLPVYITLSSTIEAQQLYGMVTKTMLPFYKFGFAIQCFLM